MSNIHLEKAKTALLDAFDTLEGMKSNYVALGQEWDAIHAVQKLIVNRNQVISNLQAERTWRDRGAFKE
jgi:hypothetical protein